MNLEKARLEVLSHDYFKMIKDIELRQKFFDIYTMLGEEICRKCPSQWFPAYQRLKRYSFINIKPMSQKKWIFKKGKSIRKGDIVFSNMNITDEKAEELMEEEEGYKPFFEINPRFAIEQIEESASEGKDEKTELKAQIEEITGEKPKGNPGIDTLKKKLEEAKAAKEKA